MSKINLFDLNQAALARLCEDLGERAFRARQLFQWIYQRGLTDFGQMSDISRKFREVLGQHVELVVPELESAHEAGDGTIKWALKLADGNRVETVLIPETNRKTLCVSSQVGCALNCSFCYTARQGFNRDLRVSEIIAQLWVVNKYLQERQQGRVTNVVFMGMGEPLLNFQPVVDAVDIMLDDYAFGLSKRRVTISTSGLVPGIYELARVKPVALAVSLHAADDALRDQLVPVNRKFPLGSLMDACRDYAQSGPRKRITMEYVMLEGVNDRDKDAANLARVLSRVPSKINLIPFNPFPGSAYRCSSMDRIRRFQSQLQEKGFVVTIRKTRGRDIVAACGQLAGKVLKRLPRRLLREPKEAV